jgi:molybdate transport system substrate-binding protein
MFQPRGMTIENRSRFFFVLAAIFVCTSAAGGCGETPSQSAAKHDTLIVFAASSLREAFTAIGADMQAAHPGLQVTFNFSGSQELRTQLEQGAVADVFASADQKHMAALVKAGSVGEPVVFARNEPVIVISRTLAGQVNTLADLPTAERIVLGAPDVPIGHYTQQILDNASHTLGADFATRVRAHVVSQELNVKQVLAKVTLGEADAAIVYRSDALAAGERVAVVTIAPELNVIAEYPMAVLKASSQPALAQELMQRVQSPSGRARLAHAGFLPALPSSAGLH